MTKIISKNDIISAMSYCAVRQSPYTFPKNLQIALQSLSDKIDEKLIFESSVKQNVKSYKEVDNDQLYNLIKDLVYSTPEIAIWNLTQYELDKGFTDPDDDNRPILGLIVGRGVNPQPDYDFIDLDALVRNVTNLILNND